MRVYHIAIVGMLLFVTIASKAEVIFGNIVSNGSGCPAGSTSLKVTPEGDLAIDLDRFETQAGLSGKVDAKTCNIAIPIQVPKGFRLAVGSAEIDGRVVVKRGKATITTETFFAGSKGKVISKRYTGNRNVSVRLPSSRTDLVSQCGASLILRVSVNATAEVKTVTQKASVAIHEIAPISRLHFKECI